MTRYSLDASFYETEEHANIRLAGWKQMSHSYFTYALGEAKRKNAWVKSRITEYGLTEKEAMRHATIEERRDSDCRIISCNLTIEWTPWLRFKVWLRKRRAK